MQRNLLLKERLNNLRKERGLTYIDVEKGTGISKSNLQRLEYDSPDLNAHDTRVGYQDIVALAKFYNVSADYLCGLTENLRYSNTAVDKLHLSDEAVSMPIIGGADGGLFTCARDLDTLWRSIFSNEILSENMMLSFLKTHVKRSGDNEQSRSYGLGVYVAKNDKKTIYYTVGGDYGVDFFTAYFPNQKIVASALGNTEINTYPILEAMITAPDID